MHVLVAAHDLYPDPGSGGTGRYVHETARRLVDRGHRVSVVTRRRGDVPDRETVRGIEVARYDLPVADRSLPAILPRVPGALRAVSRHVDALCDGDPDVVSFQGPVTSLLVDRAVGPAAARTCVFHSPWPTEYRLRTLGEAGADSRLRRAANARARRLVERRLLGRTAGVVTLSEFMRGVLRETYGAVGETAVVPGGVDADRFGPDAGSYGPVETDGVALLTVRRLTPRMGHELLLEAFAAVAGDRDDVELYVAGDGPLREALPRKAAALGVDDRTTFLGYVPDDDLPRAYATADLFVLPTVALEGFGLATLEALASGTPAVGTAVGGTREILGPLEQSVDLPAGALVDPAGPAALARRLAAWVDLPADCLSAAGRDCRAFVREQFGWDRTVDGLTAAYGSALGRPVSPGRRPAPGGRS